MSQPFGTNLKNALEEAREIFHENVEIPKQYIEALYLTQFFEILLENLYSSLVTKGSTYFISIGLDYQPEKRDNWTINDYLIRLKTFFPSSKYKSTYDKLTFARDKRNEFIHKCFKIKHGEIYGISLDKEKMHLDANALKKVEEWVNAYNEAFHVILGLMLKVRK
jgi:hypothetical protein